jgi:hypothetical protein
MAPALLNKGRMIESAISAHFLARIMGLKVLRGNADTQAVELALPLLRDTNSLVRNRAFSALQNISGRDIPKDNPEKWEHWWAANKATFVPQKSAR